jgi:hypothetical protein
MPKRPNKLGVLITRGKVKVGDTLHLRNTKHTATVLSGGRLKAGAKVFASPSAAGVHFNNHETNGCHEWKNADGKSINELYDARSVETDNNEVKEVTM